jgi:hypothetical protein
MEFFTADERPRNDQAQQLVLIRLEVDDRFQDPQEFQQLEAPLVWPASDVGGVYRVS